MPRKIDLSNLSHDKPQVHRFKGVERILIAAAGHSPNTIGEYCDDEHANTIMWSGAIVVGAGGLTALDTSFILHMAMGDGGFHPTYVLVGLAVGSLQAAIDVVVQYKGRAHDKGLAEMRRTGIKLAASAKTSWLTHIIQPVRFLQAGALGAAGGVFFSLWMAGPDIRAHIDNAWLAQNRAAAQETTIRVDADIARSAADLKTATAVVDQANRLRNSLQNLSVSRLRTAQRGRAVSTAATDTQIASIQRGLPEAIAARDRLRDALERKVKDRPRAIEQGVLSSPDHTEKQDGIPAQLRVLFEMARENVYLALLIAGFEIISLALELGPMWCAASAIPSALAARLAMRHYVEVSKIRDQGERDLGLAVAPPEDAFDENVEVHEPDHMSPTAPEFPEAEDVDLTEAVEPMPDSALKAARSSDPDGTRAASAAHSSIAAALGLPRRRRRQSSSDHNNAPNGEDHG